MVNRLTLIKNNLRQEFAVYQLILKDDRTPRLAQLLLALAIGYLLLPFDLIPDFIPLIGHIDDALIVPLLIFISLKLIPPFIIQDCRKQCNCADLKSA